MLEFDYSIIEYIMRGKTNPFPSFEYALLGLLYQGPAHGYELHKTIAEPDGIGMIWGVKISNLYAQLAKLEKAGLIKGEVQTVEDRPARTEFHLTDKGKVEFEGWLNRLVQHPREIRQEFMLKYYLVASLLPDLLPGVCVNQLEECQRWLSNSAKKQKQSGKGSFTHAIMEFRTSQIKSMVDWLQWLIAHPPTIPNHKEKK